MSDTHSSGVGLANILFLSSVVLPDELVDPYARRCYYCTHGHISRLLHLPKHDFLHEFEPFKSLTDQAHLKGNPYQRALNLAEVPL